MERIVNIALQADTNDYIDGMTAAADSANSFNEAVTKTVGIAAGVSKALSMVAPTRTIGAWVAAGVAAANYNKQMSGLRATTDVLAKSNQSLNFEKLAKSTRVMSREFGISTKESTALVAQFQGIGVRGLQAEKRLASLSSATAKLAAANGENSQALAASFGQLSKQFNNLNASSYERMGDSLTYVSKATGSSAMAISQFSRSIAPFAKELGIGQQAVMGISAAFTTLGEDSFVAQNATSKMLSDIGRSIRDNTDDLKTYAEAVNLTEDNFKQLFESNPEEGIRRLFEAVSKSGQGIRTLERMGIEGVRGQRAFASVVQSGTLNEALAAATSPTAAGATQAAFEAMTNDMFTSMQEAAESMKQVVAAVGAPMRRPLTGLAAGVSGIADLTAGVMTSKPVQTALSAAAVMTVPLLLGKAVSGILFPAMIARSGLFPGMRAGRASRMEEEGLPPPQGAARRLAEWRKAEAEAEAGTGRGPSRAAAAGYQMGRRWYDLRAEAGSRAADMRAAYRDWRSGGAGEAPTTGPMGGAGSGRWAARLRQSFAMASTALVDATQAYVTATITDPARQITSKGPVRLLPEGLTSRMGGFGQRLAGWTTIDRPDWTTRRPATGADIGSEQARKLNRDIRAAMGWTFDESKQAWAKTESPGLRGGLEGLTKATRDYYGSLKGLTAETNSTSRAFGSLAKGMGRAGLAGGWGIAKAGTQLGAEAVSTVGGWAGRAGMGLVKAIGPEALALGALFAGGMALQNKAKQDEERAAAFADPYRVVRTYKDALGETTPEIARLGESTKGATEKLVEMSKSAKSWKDVFQMPREAAFLGQVGLMKEPSYRFQSTDVQGVVGEVLAMSPSMTKADMALALADITKQLGADVAKSVGQELSGFEPFGGTKQVGSEAIVGMLRESVTNQEGLWKSLAPWTKQDKLENAANQMGAFLQTQYARDQESMTVSAALDKQMTTASQMFQGYIQQRTGGTTDWMTARVSNEPRSAEFRGQQTDIATVLEQGFIQVTGSEKIGDAVYNAIAGNGAPLGTGKLNTAVQQAVRTGESPEDVIKTLLKEEKAGRAEMTKDQRREAEQWLSQQKTLRESATQDPFWKDYEAAAGNLNMQLNTVGNAVTLVERSTNEAQKAWLKSGGTDFAALPKAVDNLVAGMRQQGHDEASLVGSLVETAYNYSPSSAQFKEYMTAAAKVSAQHTVQQVMVGTPALAEQQRWGSTSATLLNLSGKKNMTETDMTRLQGAWQDAADQFVDISNRYGQIEQARAEHAKATARAEQDYTRQRRYAQEDFARQQRWQAEDYDKTRRRADEDYGLARARAGEDYDKQRYRAEVDYNKSRSRAVEDFNISQERAVRDYNISRQRAERDYLIGRERAQRDYDKQMLRAQRDYDISRERAQRDFDRSRHRAERDYEKQRVRAQRDFEKGQRRQIEEFARTALEPFKRYGPRASMTSGGLVTNLGAQNRLMARQMQGIEQLRGAGLSEQAVRVLGLASPESYSQVQQLAKGVAANPGRIAEINAEVLKRMDLAGQMAPMQTSWQQQVEDFNQQMKDMGDDYATTMKDMEDDFRVSMDDMAADFARSMSDAAEDFALSMSDSAADFARSMADMAESFNISMADARDEFTKSMARMAADFADAMTRMADDYAQQTARMEADHKQAMARMAEDYASAVARSAVSFATAMARQGEAFKESMRRADQDFKASLDAMNGKWSAIGAQMALSSNATAKAIYDALVTNDKTGFAGVLKALNGSYTVSPTLTFSPNWNMPQASWVMDTGGDSVMPEPTYSGPLSGMSFRTRDDEGYGPDSRTGNAPNTQGLINLVSRMWGITGHGFASGGHSTNSLHYRGKAVDISVGNNRALGNQIASYMTNPMVAQAFGVRNIIWYRQKNNGATGMGWQPYVGNGVGDSDHVRHVHVGLWRRGGIALGPQLGVVAEAGKPETMIPLDDRGARFFVQAMSRYIGRDDARRTVAATSGQPMVVNVGTTIDQSTRFTGEVTVMANDPDMMARQLMARARSRNLTVGRR